MNDVQFDAWTRRRFGLTTGIAAAVISLGLATGDAVGKRRKKEPKKRCKRVLAKCGSGRRCCGSLKCKRPEGDSKKRCCKKLGKTCSKFEECCGQAGCGCNGPNSEKICTNLPAPCPA